MDTNGFLPESFLQECLPVEQGHSVINVIGETVTMNANSISLTRHNKALQSGMTCGNERYATP